MGTLMDKECQSLLNQLIYWVLPTKNPTWESYKGDQVKELDVPFSCDQIQHLPEAGKYTSTRYPVKRCNART